MEASAWCNGNGTYGIRVGTRNRDRHFERTWKEIEVEMDGQFHRFSLTEGFWDDCPEFRDHGAPIICEWLRQYRTLEWERDCPPRMMLVPLGGGQFRLLA